MDGVGPCRLASQVVDRNVDAGVSRPNDSQGLEHLATARPDDATSGLKLGATDSDLTPPASPETPFLGKDGVMSGSTSKRYPAELRERAVRMVAEIRADHDSEWAAMAKVAELARRRQMLLDAYMADALPIDFLKAEQSKVGVEIADAKRLIAEASEAVERAQKYLDQVIDLLTDACTLYQQLGGNGRSALNAVVFDYFALDSAPDDEGAVRVKVAGAPLSDVVAAVLAPGTTGDPQGPHSETPAEPSSDGGSNLSKLAEAEGFEPSMGL